MEQKLEALLDLLDTKQNAEDFTKAVEACVDIFVAMKADNEEERADLKNTLDASLAKLRTYNETRWAKVQEKVQALRDGRDGKDGRDGIDGVDGADGQPGRDGKDGSPDTPEEIVQKLESLEGDNRLDASAIKGLDEKIKEAAPKQNNTVIAYARGGVRAHDLSPSLNGVTKTFNIPTVWRIISVHSSSFPNIFRETVDYTWTPTTITFTDEIDAASTLATGQTITIVYAEA